MHIKPWRFIVVMTVFALCSACGAANGNNPESDTAIADMPEDSISVFAESDAGTVVDEQTEIGLADTYTVSAGCAGPFKIGATIPEVLDGFTVMKSKEEKTLPDGGGVRDIPVYFYEIGNEGWVKISPQYDAATDCIIDRTSEIFIYSDLFLTDKGIGAMSSITEFAIAYPDFNIRYDNETEVYIAETPQLDNVQFIISDEYCQDIQSSGCAGLKLSDFKDEAYFTAIRIIKQSPNP